jgi:lipopolysaccharide export LptBFGC system permease protein LptF
VKAPKKLNWRVVIPIATGSLVLIDAALIARDDALGSSLLAVGGVVLVIFGFWNWSK